MHPMKLSRFLMHLEQRGLIKQVGSNRQTGHEYNITVWDDYQLLESHVNILDRVLEKLKSKSNGKTETFHTAFTPLSQATDVKENEININ